VPKTKEQIIEKREIEEAKRSANVAKELLPDQWSEK
jgi:hypothetical protein